MVMPNSPGLYYVDRDNNVYRLDADPVPAIRQPERGVLLVLLDYALQRLTLPIFFQQLKPAAAGQAQRPDPVCMLPDCGCEGEAHA